jgi:hypothetical protein
MITCYRCVPFDQPQVLIVEKPLGGELCPKCGIAMVNILEVIAIAPLYNETIEFSEEEIEFSQEQNEALEAGEIVETISYEAVMEVPTPAIDDTEATFEEVDQMTVEELFTLADKLKILIPINIETDELRDVIKKTLQS